MVRALLLAAGLIAAPAASGAQSAPPPETAEAPESAEHVSRGLQTQQPLRIPPEPPPAQPTFRAEVPGTLPLETALDAVRRELGATPRPGHLVTPLTGVEGMVAGSQVDVLPAILGLVHKIQRARYERTERQIQADVTAELADFCEVNDCSVVNEGLVLPKTPR